MGEFVSVQDALKTAFESIGFPDHIPAEPGDFVAEDGYLHCGVCRERKEFKFPLSGKMVPSLCLCGKAKIEREEEEKRRKEERERVSRLFAYSVIDERFHESTFDNFTVRDEAGAKLLRRLQNYVDNFDVMYQNNTGLMFFGPPGGGKTFAADCIANALIDRGIPVLVTSIIKLTGGSIFGEDLQETLRVMKNARLLVLDDLGAERYTDFKSEQIFDVIDSRYNSKRPIIITTNITDFRNETDIRRRRVYDRIMEMCIPIKVEGESWRRQAATDKRKNIISILDQ